MIVFGQAGTQPKMAEKRAWRKAKSDRVFGQGKNDGKTDALIRKNPTSTGIDQISSQEAGRARR
jgi:hypothetical protein